MNCHLATATHIKHTYTFQIIQSFLLKCSSCQNFSPHKILQQKHKIRMKYMSELFGIFQISCNVMRTVRKRFLAKNLLRIPTNGLGFMNVIFLCGNHQHALGTHGHLQGGENKKTNTIIMCQNHSTVKDRIVFC